MKPNSKLFDFILLFSLLPALFSLLIMLKLIEVIKRA